MNTGLFQIWLFFNSYRFFIGVRSESGTKRRLVTRDRCKKSTQGNGQFLVTKAIRARPSFAELSPYAQTARGISVSKGGCREKAIYGDRIIVENYLGRFCGLWNVIGCKW